MSNVNEKKQNSVAWRDITLCVVSILAGITILGVIQNFLKDEKLVFSTLDLISFFITVGLGGASIALSFSAIHLGSASEKAMIQRSDESIRLQTDVFSKTTDALQKIQSSTDVTGKRLEDLLEGRAGVISQKVFDAVAEGQTQKLDRKALEEQIKDSILDSLRGKDVPADSETKQKKIVESQNYQIYKNQVLLRVSNLEGVKIHKFGDGRMESVGADMVDGLFEKGVKKLAVAIFSKPVFFEQHGGSSPGFINYISQLVNEIRKGTFTDVVVCFNQDLDAQSSVVKHIDEIKSVLLPTLSEKLKIIGEPSSEKCVDRIKEIFA